MMSIKVVATSALAIVAVTALVAIYGFISSGNAELLKYASTTVGLVVVGAIAIAVLINLPRLIR